MSAVADDRSRPAETVAGLLAAGALFLGAFEFLYRPFRLAPAALIMLLVATVMSSEQHRLIKAGFVVVGVGFVVGSTIQILTHHPLY